jgi:hypothetical protein
MPYRVTPLNICCGLLVGCEIVFFAFPQSRRGETYGYQHVYLIPVIIVCFLLDWLMQKFIAKSWLLVGIQLLFIIMVIILNIRF